MNKNNGFQASTHACLACWNVSIAPVLAISIYTAVKCVPSAHCFVKHCSEMLRLVQKVSALLLHQCYCTAAQPRSEHWPRPTCWLSESLGTAALLLLECPCGASWLHLCVWASWGLREKKSYDARLRKSTCPFTLLWPSVVYPERQ